jgi:C-terminal processing protease CtpA/Prc
MRDHSLQKFQLKFGNESNNIFYLIDNYWTRLYPENNLTINEKLLISFNNSKIPFIQQLNDKTLYLRIPSFYYNQKRYIDSILFKYDSLLKSTPNLIIDIRNGTGGSSHSWEKIIPYLYTNPIRLANNLYKASELNAKEYDNYAKDFKDSIISTRCHLTAIRMREHIGELISLSDSKYVNFTLEKVYPYPHNVGIICNKANASADEGFLTYAIQSKKVKLFGTTTAGMIDIANMKTIDFPDGNFVLYYGMTISTSAHENPIEGIGFQPDYFIDSSIDENDRIEYTKSILEH